MKPHCKRGQLSSFAEAEMNRASLNCNEYKTGHQKGFPFIFAEAEGNRTSLNRNGLAL